MHPIDKLIGKPFVNGGRGPDSYDCWGLVCEVFKMYGIELPDYKISCEDVSLIDGEINEQRNRWCRCEGEPPVPALVVMRFNQAVFCNHTGVYIGDGRFIHTAEKMGVHIDHIDSPAWRRKIEGLYVPGWLDG
ncbi:NlpC/P60 family protein [Pelosinus sp. IPA-1]|uniref:C40 family peptidase n=1 Tax=Pelosinus sp. IPA-1 TaxID=3029569 RepID=UPI0024362844|nr:NlpC/P60 family protein [Pelosinus sp. IPA-1]GMB00240.1 hypothetical protein PIPA1_30390 [Pelosinus sp. IPA-1]